MLNRSQPGQNSPKGSPGLNNPKALSTSLLCNSPARSKIQRASASRPRLIAKAITRSCLRIAVFLALIASSSVAQEPPAAAKSEGKKAEGSSTCFFYRYRLSRGSLEKIGVYIDGVRAANLVNGRWVAIQVPAGHHEIRTKDKASGGRRRHGGGIELLLPNRMGRTRDVSPCSSADHGGSERASRLRNGTTETAGREGRQLAGREPAHSREVMQKKTHSA